MENTRRARQEMVQRLFLDRIDLQRSGRGIAKAVKLRPGSCE